MAHVDTSSASTRWKTEQWKPGDTLYLVELPDRPSKRKIGERFTLVSVSQYGGWAQVRSEVTGKYSNFYPRRFSKFYGIQLELFDEP